MFKLSRAQMLALTAAVLVNTGFSNAQAGLCTLPTANSLNCQMTNGARWELSWKNDAKKGFVLSQINLTAKANAPRTLILDSASLADVSVTYDNTTNPSLILHQLNTGLPLLALNDNIDCPLNPGTNRLKAGGTGSTLVCQMFLPRGYAWRGTGQIQGEQLVLFGLSSVAGDTYIQQWVFSDDGSIQPMLGISGQLDPAHDSAAATGWPIGPSGATRYATNRYHTAFWRLDFAMGGQANDRFQQLNYTAGTTGKNYNQSVTDITTENKFTVSPDNMRFWSVKDTVISNVSNGQKIAFQMVLPNTAVQRGSDSLTSADVYVTQGGANKVCEQFASFNPATPTYSNNTPCANGLTQFVNGETVTDPVVWLGTTWHQIPRAEDEVNFQTHWQGVILAPRDISATSPFN